MRDSMDIVTRIAQVAAALRPAERKVAQTILGDIAGAAEMSIRALAERAEVSEASVTRFARATGCRDVRELKRRLVQASTVGRRFLDSEQAHPPTSAESILADIDAVLETNRALVQPDVFRAAAHSLVAARMIIVLGTGGGSTVMADEMRYRLARLGCPVASYQDALFQRMVAATLSARDVMIVLSVSGHVPEIIDSVSIAREYGAHVIAITAVGSPLAGLANVLLPVQAMETDFIFKPSSSRYALMMMIDLLSTEVAVLQADRSQELLRRAKYVLDAHRGGGNRQPLGD
ncbi:MurR/RpiR family transcriptional regulator [Dyella acidiphila]|uniref:MurR/RpiR family transcriptional regulator n=1 Tax=Dyella acidiphila TaxID=2775866 RepID=A0ABR9G5I8_9GAMM|nr:MurR/RpiR family transcriptional regulator [Dyella acidiphila]MBE1159315.1 MurR/RpiR family transcriptional regulator [Dyella acidiphila]